MKLRSFSLVGVVACALMVACSAEQGPSADGSTLPQHRQRTSPLKAGEKFLSGSPATGSFELFAGGAAAPLFVSPGDHVGVIRAATDLQTDVERVSGVKPTLTEADSATGTKAIIIGTLGESALIDALAAAGKIDGSALDGKWESYVIEVVDQPAAGVDQALVIAGSDKRGTIFGIYELSEEMGVSPWHYWADVPAQQHSELYVKAGAHTRGEPAVKYRGLFINDENPALYDWYREAYQAPDNGFNSAFYKQVFELILRLKGNYLWPAMWGKSFNVDDAMNPQLADEYGVVMGTSHHEPLTRSEQEWYDNGHTEEDWSYSSNAAALQSFWQGGVERMGDRETLVTVGMRGSGDKPNPDQGIPLMESIVSAQRQIIGDVTGKDPATVPQVWTLYKEVQSYYDGGMEVPDDITLMFADDNWGNIRRLPPQQELTRTGGYGVYYHYDYVGGPRSYRWLNTNPVPRVWEQMRRAYALGAKQIWIVNVGDIKPMEYPLHFFMDLAWDPEGWTPGRLMDYPRRWAAAQFGSEHAEEIGQLVSEYSKFNGRRKPELMSASTYNLENYREADTVVDSYNALVTKAEELEAQLPENMKDAYYQLVLHPILACANLNEMYVSQAKNQRFAGQGRASTNTMADRVGDLYENDTTITNRYHSIAGGKWNHMMKQTHIGYTSWDNPEVQVRPSTQTIQASGAASIGASIEGSTQGLTPASGAATLPELSVYYPQEVRHVEIYNRGAGSFDFTAASDQAYVTVEPNTGTVGDDVTLKVSVDWAQVPEGDSDALITVSGEGGDIDVVLPLRKPSTPTPTEVVGFVENAGYVSVDASHYTDKVEQAGVAWSTIPDLGRTGSAVHIQPDTAAAVTAGGDTPQLHYKMYFFEPGQVEVRVYLSPSLPVLGQHYRYAVSFDDQAPQTVDIHQGLPSDFNDTAPIWEGWVSDNIIVKSTNLTLSGAGEHTLKLWMVDAGVVVQKIVVARSGLPASYLGPPARLPLNVEIEEVVPDRGESDGPSNGSGGGATDGGGGSSGSTGGSGGGAGNGTSTGGGSSNETSGDGDGEPDPGSSSGTPGAEEKTGCSCSSVGMRPRGMAYGPLLLLVGLGALSRRLVKRRAA